MAIIRKEEGGSVMSFDSSGSLNVSVGAKVTLGVDATTNNTAYEVLKVGANALWYSASTASPIFSASPGDLLWLAQSASTQFWVNISDGTTGSNWAPVGHAGTSVIDDLR